MNDPKFRERVYAVVAQIPPGRIMTYGDIAAMAGQAHAARIVGGIAHFGSIELPWHRVVNRFGGLASGYPGGKRGHQKDLETEGVPIKDFIITDFEERRWTPGL
ncbi:MGMT family protein [Candidatus Saccharibacteria bacterium]|nr:MGMT family protein [Candidatus Saccharibacteria bacterium]